MGDLTKILTEKQKLYDDFKKIFTKEQILYEDGEDPWSRSKETKIVRPMNLSEIIEKKRNGLSDYEFSILRKIFPKVGDIEKYIKVCDNVQYNTKCKYRLLTPEDLYFGRSRKSRKNKRKSRKNKRKSRKSP